MYFATRRSRSGLVSRTLLALVLTAASFAVFLESERVTVPTSTLAALSDRQAG